MLHARRWLVTVAMLLGAVTPGFAQTPAKPDVAVLDVAEERDLVPERLWLLLPADDNNGQPSATGQFALTPAKDLTTSLNWIAGKEYSFDGIGHLANGGTRFVLDWVAT